MVRKLNGGGCGCGSSGLLGFPQNGGQMKEYGMAKQPLESSSFGNSNSSMRMNSSMPKKKSRKISATRIMHTNGRTLNQHMDNIHGQLDQIQATQGSAPINSSSGGPGLFGGGIFDFFAPKNPPMPAGVSHSTLPHNQPPTLQEVVRDLQLRVKSLEEETRPSTIGGRRKTSPRTRKVSKK